MKNRTSPYTRDQEAKLFEAIMDPNIRDNPYNFVMYVFPWGKPNTPLAKTSFPRSWQTDVLKTMAEHIQNQKEREMLNLIAEVFRLAVSSGRGIGKSALVAWIILWFMSTRLGGTCIVTANNETQLKSKTWAELGKWHTLALNGHWFERNTLKLTPVPWFDEMLKKQLMIDTGYYYAEAVLWSEERPDSFAGAHSMIGTMVIKDEASGIPQPIWTVSEGFFTEPVMHRYYLAFSNPRRNTGPFFDIFHKDREFWKNRRQIDSRTVEGTDRAVYDTMIKKYGEDSDEARVEVKGQFPRQSDAQFISRDLIEQAMLREPESDMFAPLIMGVDVARFGDDSTAIIFRRGRDAKSIPMVLMKSKSNMEVANEIGRLIDLHNPDAVMIDIGGGAGVVDRLREMKYQIIEVNFGLESSDPQYKFKRTEMWGSVKEWLETGALINDNDLRDDLAGPEFKYVGQSDVKILESKAEMKARHLPSPDRADALACTFFKRIARKDKNAYHNRNKRKRGEALPGTSDYNPLEGL